MSRATFSNERYTLAFGVDHTPIGAFFQVWDRKWQGEKGTYGPLTDMDCFGLVIRSQEQIDQNPKLARILLDLERAYTDSLDRGVDRPNLGASHVIQVAKALGFDDVTLKAIERKVYELWD